MKKIRLFLTLISILSPIGGFANFQNALTIYESGDFERAREAFEALASIGDTSSLFNLGVMDFRGEAGERNAARAHALIKIALDSSKNDNHRKTLDIIEKSMSSEELAGAASKYQALQSTYSIDTVRAQLTPKPLPDELCGREAVPIEKPLPRYPKAAQVRGQMGTTDLQVTISPEGYPRDITVLQSTNDAFSKSSLKAASRLRYESSKQGSPTLSAQYRYVYKIKVDQERDVKTKIIRQSVTNARSKAEAGNAAAQYQYAKQLDIYRAYSEYLGKLDLQYKTANEWLHKSAVSGIPNAQYEIGLRMMKGLGCEVDQKGGMKWIAAAAYGGYSPARRTIGQKNLEQADASLERALAGITWLRAASDNGDYIATVWLAWELATSPFDVVRDGKEALRLLNESSPENYYDDVRVLETTAAAHAAVGDFANAVKLQKKAAKAAKKLRWDIPLIAHRLSAYESNKPVREKYF